MTARFAGENDLQAVLEQGYESHVTTKGKILLPPETQINKDTVTFGLERFLGKANITISGIDLISNRV